MNEQLLKMNGLSVGILDALSFESHLGIPLKKNLHYFDKDLLIAELISMTEWLDEQEILSNIALDYRVKSLDSILLKYDRYYPDHQTRKVFNDILGFRAFCDSYDQILEEEFSPFRIADMAKGKAVDDGYRGVHVYYQKSAALSRSTVMTPFSPPVYQLTYSVPDSVSVASPIWKVMVASLAWFIWAQSAFKDASSEVTWIGV